MFKNKFKLYFKTKKKFSKSVIGYSGHEINLSSTLGAFVLGAKIIERHITLDRSMWGTDQKHLLSRLEFQDLLEI